MRDFLQFIESRIRHHQDFAKRLRKRREAYLDRLEAKKNQKKVAAPIDRRRHRCLAFEWHVCGQTTKAIANRLKVSTTVVQQEMDQAERQYSKCLFGSGYLGNGEFNQRWREFSGGHGRKTFWQHRKSDLALTNLQRIHVAFGRGAKLQLPKRGIIS